MDLVEGFLSSPAVLLLGLTKRLSVVGLPVGFTVGALVGLLAVLLVEGLATVFVGSGFAVFLTADFVDSGFVMGLIVAFVGTGFNVG